MRFLNLGLAILAFLSIEPVLAATTTTTVTKCTATKTNTVTKTTSKTITKALITTTVVTTKSKTVSVTVTKPSTVTVKSTVTSTLKSTVTSTLKSTVTSTLKSTITTVLKSTVTSTLATTVVSTQTSIQKACMPTLVNVVPNGGFEYATTGWDPQTLPSGGGSLSAICTSDPVWVRSGECAIAARFSGPTGETMSIQRTVTFCAGSHYEVKLDYKITGTCSLVLSYAGQPIKTLENTGNPAEWKAASFLLDTPAVAGSLTADSVVKAEFLSGSVGACGISLDDLSIQQIS